MLSPNDAFQLGFRCTTHRVNWKLTEMSKADNGEYVLLYDTPEGQTEVRAKSIVLTVPAYVAAELVKKESVSG